MTELQDWLSRIRSINTAPPQEIAEGPPLMDPNTLRSLLSSRRAASLGQGATLSTNYGNNSSLVQPTTGIRREGSNDFEAFVNSIAKQESGGRYSAVNRSSNALGKYQILASNIPSWSKRALGRSITPQQFLKSPQLQEAIARYQLQKYYNKYGAAGASQAWYGGEGSVGRNVSGGKGYPTSNNYAKAILRRMGR